MSSLKQLTERLQAAGIHNAPREARLLVCHGVGCSYESLLFDNTYTLTPQQMDVIEPLMQRRLNHEPLSKILEKREFWGLNFKVTRHTLDPRPDSETLVAAVLKKYPDKKLPLSIIDFGTGTGCLLLSLLHEYPAAFGVGVDLSFDALRVAQENAENLKMLDRSVFVKANWGDGCVGPYDLIISNPPYIGIHEALDHSVRLYDPPLALFAEDGGLKAYDQLLSSIGILCHAKTQIFLEIGRGQEAKVEAIAKSYSFRLIETYTDLAGIQRVLHFILEEAQQELFFPED